MIRRGAAPELAEDLAIETFVNLWTKAGEFNLRNRSAAGWIFTISRNTSIDALRGERHPSDLVAQMDAAPGPTTTEGDHLSAERENRVRSAMNCLPPEQAQVLEM